MAELNVEIVAEDHFVWSGPAKSVSARTIEGDIGVLPGHTPLLAVLAGDGPLVVEPVQGAPIKATIAGGFFSVDSDRVVIVADNAQLDSPAA